MNGQMLLIVLTGLVLGIAAETIAGGVEFEYLFTGEVVTDSGTSAGAAWGDYDDDGDVDLYITNWSDQVNLLYRNDGDGKLTRLSLPGITTDRGHSSGPAWGDVDNDGDLDLFVPSYAAPNHLYLNDGAGGFETFEPLGVPDMAHFSTGHAWADYDRDGDLDLVLANWQNQNNSLTPNRGAGNHWLEVRLRSTTHNLRAVGAVVRVNTNQGGREVWQRHDITASAGFRSQEPASAFFGLGSVTMVAELQISWPSGEEERLEQVAVDRVITVRQGEGVVASKTPEPAVPSIGEALLSTITDKGIEEGIRRYQVLKQQQPQAWDYSAAALSSLATQLKHQDRNDEAQAIAELAVSAYPAAGTAREHLAQLYLTLGLLDEAAATYRRRHSWLAFSFAMRRSSSWKSFASDSQSLTSNYTPTRPV